MSLRPRLALLSALLVLGGVAAGLVVTYNVLQSGSNLSLDRESAILAEVIHEAVLLRGDTVIRVPAVVETYLADETGVRSAQVYQAGQLLWEGGVLDAPRPLDPAGLVEGKGTNTVSGWRVVTHFDEGDGITVQVGRPLAGLRETLAPFAWLSLPLTLGLTLVAGTLAWLFTGVALRPLLTLTRAVSAGDVSDVPAITGTGEPARLAQAFRALVHRLQDQRRREREFLAYASHELRTPLSALRASLDAAHAKSTVTPETIDRLRREAARLESLAQNLLALSRAESSELQRDTVDLADLAADTYDRFQPLAVTKGVDLELAALPATTRADPRLVSQALDNLVHNALRATSNGTVTVSTGVSAGRPWLEVSDTGPGFPANLRDGLGLRVVRAVAAAHVADVELRSEDGARVRILFPA